ncbi:MAG: outer membrane beta-barrel protein [Vicinamibacterales bacterium]
MLNPLRLLLIAAVTILGMASSAAAQTVMVRGAAPGDTVEVMVNGAVAGTGTVDATGVGTAGFALPPGAAASPEMNVRLYVDACGTTRRVHVVEQAQLPPDPQADCTRSDIGGIYWVRPRSTIVVFVANPIPTILLRQGSYNPNAGGPRRPSPTGLVLFGGGGLAQLPDLFVVPCGNVSECGGDETVGAFTAGAGFWLTRWFGVEASYTRPSKLSGEGTFVDFTFTDTVDLHVVNVVGKLAIPLGPVRLYGQGGGNWHEGTSTTVQTLGEDSQTFEFKAEGWGWTAGAGIEAWVAPAFALYLEGNLSQLNGDAIDDSRREFSNRMRTVVFGARVKLF